jgi:hypothetical protein
MNCCRLGLAPIKRIRLRRRVRAGMAVLLGTEVSLHEKSCSDDVSLRAGPGRRDIITVIYRRSNLQGLIRALAFASLQRGLDFSCREVRSSEKYFSITE